MASKIVKCNNCNIVINEVLAFIQNKIDVMNEESLVRICETAFTASEINLAKNLLFDSINTEVRKKIRKRTGKSQRDLYDVIGLLKETEPEETPVFVAKDLQKLPPISFDHIDVTRLLKDILIIQSDIKSIKESYATTKQLHQIESDLYNLKQASLVNNFNNINTKRGAYLLESHSFNSGPMGLPPMNDSCVTLGINERDSGFKNLPHLPSRSMSNSMTIVTPVAGDNGSSLSPTSNDHNTAQLSEASEDIIAESRSEIAHECKLHHSIDNNNERPVLVTVNRSAEGRADCQVNNVITNTSETDALPSHRMSFAEVLQSEGEWKVVQKRRFRNHLISQRGIAVAKSGENRFKAADIKVPLFISNVHKDVTEQDIISYIYEKTRETVSLVKIKMKHERDYNAYKLFVTKYKLDAFLDDKLWPAGISFRRFVNSYERHEREGNIGNKERLLSNTHDG